MFNIKVLSAEDQNMVRQHITFLQQDGNMEERDISFFVIPEPKEE